MAKESDEIKELKKLKKEFTTEVVEEETVKIINEGKQTAVRIPARFSDFLNLQSRKYRFKFTLTMPKEKKSAKLTGELVNGNE